tara:strand:- start:93 stop:239 length:147 start_codon:yes stop_codon:yes gene_type:complete
MNHEKIKVGVAIILAFILGVLVENLRWESEDKVMIFDMPCTLIELPTE